VRAEDIVAEKDSGEKSRDASPAARSSDNEADVSGESANNSLERPNTKPTSISSLHGLIEVSSPAVTFSTSLNIDNLHILRLIAADNIPDAYITLLPCQFSAGSGNSSE